MSAAPDRFAEAERIVAHDGPHAFEAVVPPIVQTSLFTFATTKDMVDTYAGRRTRDVYSRTTNPTVRAFEEKMAALEGAEDAIGFPSGMAAISGAVLAFVSPGDRVVCVRHVYPDAYRLFETLLRRLGVTVDYVDGTDTVAMAAAVPGARLLYLESPTSWTMEALDVGAHWRGSPAPPARFRSSTIPGRRRSFSAQCRSASISWCIRPRNISVAIPTRSQASWPGGPN